MNIFQYCVSFLVISDKYEGILLQLLHPSINLVSRLSQVKLSVIIYSNIYPFSFHSLRMTFKSIINSCSGSTVHLLVYNKINMLYNIMFLNKIGEQMPSTTYQVEMSQSQYDDYLTYLTNATNVMDVPKPTKGEFGDFNTHPTIKPLKLMKWLVKLQSNKGDTVLDPFNGSGTTAQACFEEGRNYIGCEMNQEYINISKMRLGMPEDYPEHDKWGKDEIKFLLGDCIEMMKTIPDNSIDCVITDPPYAIAIAKWDTFQTMQHFADFTEEWGKECYRILKPGGTISSFNAARTYHWMASALDKAGFICRDCIQWVYWSGMPKGKNLKGCTEAIYMGWKNADEKGKPVPVSSMTYNLDDVRIPIKEKKVKGDKDSKLVSVNKLEFKVTTSNMKAVKF